MSTEQSDVPAPQEETAESLQPAEQTAAVASSNGEEPGPASGSWLRNLRYRLVSGVPAAIVVLVGIGFAPTFLVGLVVAALGTVALIEFYLMLPESMRGRLRIEPYAAFAALVGLGGAFFGVAGANALLALGAVAVALLVWLAEDESAADSLATGGTAVAGLILVPWLISHLTAIHGLQGGGGLLALLVVVVSLNDTLAYLAGSLFGRKPLLPKISPNKTVEGALAGICGGVGGGFLMWLWLLSFSHGPSLAEALLLGGFLAVLAQVGDLLESKIKRLAGVEEAGHFLPGHGGLLDRMDAYLIGAPALYYYGVLSSTAV